MSNIHSWNVPTTIIATTNATINATTNAMTNATGSDGGDDMQVFPHGRLEFALAISSLLVFGICSVMVILGMCRKLALADASNREAGAPHESKEERRRERMEFISNGLIVKEWMPEDLQVEATTGGQDTQLAGEAVHAPHSPAPPITSSTLSCEMGSDDCESLAGEEEEMADCAICLSHFKPQQLVCVSNNSSCQHVYHKNCIVDWLMKDHDECPMCRSIYLLKTV